MSICSYTGNPGAGKTYEVVKNVIIPAIKESRRVVTNIDGIDGQKILAYVEDHFGPCNGEIVLCKDEDIASDCFFPMNQDDSFSFVRPGDLVVIDEAQNYYRTGQKLSDYECRFFREHRHFCDAEGRGCDVVLISQRFVDIQPFIRGVIELCFVMCQLKVLSLPNHYTVTVYEGDLRHKISGPSIRRYQKEIFDLYRSFAVSGGMQAKVDKRQSVVTPKNILLLACLFSLLIWSILRGIALFSPDESPFFSTDKNKSAALSHPVPVSQSSAIASANPPLTKRPDGYSRRWRILGTVGVGTSRFVVVGDRDGMIRFEHPQNFTGYGSRMTGKIDGETVTKFTGEFEKKDDKGLRI